MVNLFCKKVNKPAVCRHREPAFRLGEVAIVTLAVAAVGDVV